MSEKLNTLREEFVKKQNQLETVRIQLKQEFFGIDKAIDQLIDNTRSWYMLNDYQERPLIVNLWGLTGVGKTSLIQRMAELIDYSDLLFRFDLGDKSNRAFNSGLDDLCEKNEDKPVIVVLDEFQHTRTLKGPMREEVNADVNRKVWDLIDSGKIEYYQWKRGLLDFRDHVKLLKKLLQVGVRVENGIVTKNFKLYHLEMERAEFWSDDDNDELKKIDERSRKFIKPEYYSDIIDYGGNQLGFTLQNDLSDYLLTLNGEESIAFLDRIIRIAQKPDIKIFTKALIFVVGNLDEAYDISGNLNADIHADVFYESTLKITLPKIKSALANRFRLEQIARLGNNHIIYPSLSSKAYYAIITKELKDISSKVLKGFGLKLDFAESLLHVIYKEGVFPTQGARPVKTTVNYMLQSNLPKLISEIILKNIHVNTVRLSYSKGYLEVFYDMNENEVHFKKIKVETPLETMRKPKSDDIQAITAVHESGHATLSAILLKVVPENIRSVTSDPDSLGFVYAKWPWKYIAKHEIEKRVAVFLGGIAAEELVFGKDYITAGASSDIKQATNFVSKMFKFNGMGNNVLGYSTDASDNFLCHDVSEIELEIKQMVTNGLKLAKETLQTEMKLLLKLSDYLSDNTSINKTDLEQFITAYKVTDVKFIEQADHLYYRKVLKDKANNKLNEISKNQFETITLNKKR
ncbi:hypothetical protein GCM10022271_11860 [Corallibacter vietnamensis]|uniref:Peptidase M41 domain-containing protein n=1 Tax=Corallibacter vietnamensis TaxID=904130 RepID=A0ABP7H3L1_9FLAO